MNIFFSSLCPAEAANNLNFYPKTRNKMILETAQIIATVAHHLSIPTTYKPVRNKYHEVILWVMKDFTNYCWLVQHFYCLHSNYQKDSGKTHKSYRIYDPWINETTATVIGKYTNHTELTLPYLAFSLGNEDLEEKYGHYEPNPYNKKEPYAVANTLNNAVLAYREYLKRKPYAQGMHLTFN